MLIAADPFDTPEGRRVKFTSPGFAITVMDEGSVADMLTGPTADLICADAAKGIIIQRKMTARNVAHGVLGPFPPFPNFT